MRSRLYGVSVAVVLLNSAVAFADSSAAPLQVARIADGVFVHEGLQEEADGQNRGDIANLGFVVGNKCVAVIDTGGSPSVGHALRRTIDELTTAPVCYVINTHMHPDHALGNSAFVDTQARFIAAAGFAPGLAARGATYLERAQQVLGVETSVDWLVMPDRVIKKTTALDLGDRTLLLNVWPTGHTDNDLTVFDESSRTLFTGDLLFVDRVPAIDASLTGWIGVLDSLDARSRDVAHVVPGHGPVGQRLSAMLMPEKRYLKTIRRDVQQAIADGYDLNYTSAHAAREQRDEWLLFDDYHVRNVTAAYTELEWQ
ncbi:beta-lactamase protein [Salinisphaera shabanensis E1L3A]|uniref:Beta-lactamase protein n=1 Tax=Salinisphaera shabanensis E1L3A TaxID=1033802 RepID=F7QBI2_9GAMM|nr:quinoprotein relay system zinc metallohydrolase 2 [Salinisphaera shabanensis]ERJ18481.1 beta-lactamase protein [Salinisphaera shabanensis E1L3A]